MIGNKKVVALFPGQGSQYPGMCDELIKTPKGAEVIQEASDILNLDIKRICNQDTKELYLTQIAQPILLTVSYGMYQHYLSQGGQIPELGIGHSLGELSALACAGSISFEEALNLVEFRGQVMGQVSDQYRMMAVGGIALQAIEKQIQESNKMIYISNYNAPGQTIVTALKEDIADFEKLIELAGGHSKKLKTYQPFHTPMMLEAAKAFEEKVSQLHFREPSFKVVSNVTGKAHATEHIGRRLVQQMYSPVKFIECMGLLSRSGCNLAVEFGAGRVITNLTKNNNSTIESYALDDVLKEKSNRFWEVFTVQDISDLDIVKNCMKIITSTKTFNYNLGKQTLLQEQYRKLEGLRNALEIQEEQPSNAPLESITILTRCLELKEAPKSVSESYINNLNMMISRKEVECDGK